MLVAALLALLSLDPSPALIVRVSGVASDQGRLQLAVYDSQAGWDGEAEPVATGKLSAVVPVTEWSLKDLPAGEFAVRVFHDLDGDGELDRNDRGRPTEPHAFSGGRKSLFGPPGWKKARVVVGPAGGIIEIELRGGAEPAADDGVEAAGEGEAEPASKGGSGA